jgi:hypothetical protein
MSRCVQKQEDANGAKTKTTSGARHCLIIPTIWPEISFFISLSVISPVIRVLCLVGTTNEKKKKKKRTTTIRQRLAFGFLFAMDAKVPAEMNFFFHFLKEEKKETYEQFFLRYGLPPPPIHKNGMMRGTIIHSSRAPTRDTSKQEEYSNACHDPLPND